MFFEGEFVGGCDIMMQMHKSGDLIDELKKLDIRSALLDAPTEDPAKWAMAMLHLKMQTNLHACRDLDWKIETGQNVFVHLYIIIKVQRNTEFS